MCGDQDVENVVKTCSTCQEPTTPELVTPFEQENTETAPVPDRDDNQGTLGERGMESSCRGKTFITLETASCISGGL